MSVSEQDTEEGHAHRRGRLRAGFKSAVHRSDRSIRQDYVPGTDLPGGEGAEAVFHDLVDSVQHRLNRIRHTVYSNVKRVAHHLHH
jgi:hypothetical protein